MGIAISNWRLARTVAEEGQLGVVSGTAIDSVHSRILQDGDEGGLLRNVYKKFPFQEIAQRVIDRWFSPNGRAEDAPYRPIPQFTDKSNKTLEELTVMSCFGEVALAKEENPNRQVGINLLDKVRIPQMPSLYGAMLAGVDYVLMGAGIPRHVPGVLDKLAEGQPATMKFEVEGGEEQEITFDPSEFLGQPAPKLKRPKFLAIITSATLAISLAKKASGKVDGFVVETAIAGGHNAPPRGPMQFDAEGQPVYGPRDVPELEKIAAVGLPFWIAGGYATAEKLAEAKAAGAVGVQIGTAFACCRESGMAPSLRQKLINLAKAHAIRVFTDPFASPTGFPFKISQVEDTLSEKSVYESRKRICDLGYLRHAYKRADGSLGFRCASEPVGDYVRKGGKVEDTEKRMCLCNGLLAAAGFGQIRKGGIVESMVSTAGDSLYDIVRFLKDGADSYSALDVLESLLGPLVHQEPTATPAVA